MMIATARIADIVLKATAAYDKKAASAATLAAGTPHAMAWAEFANQLAELEGEVYAYSRILNACGTAVEVPQSFMYEVAMEMLSDGAEDGWPGRTNDVRRARFDGVRTACGTLRWMM